MSSSPRNRHDSATRTQLHPDSKQYQMISIVIKRENIIIQELLEYALKDFTVFHQCQPTFINLEKSRGDAEIYDTIGETQKP